MDKSKALRNIIIYIVIIMTCMFFVGFFTAKKAYAAEFGIPEQKFLENDYEYYFDFYNDSLMPYKAIYRVSDNNEQAGSIDGKRIYMITSENPLAVINDTNGVNIKSYGLTRWIYISFDDGFNNGVRYVDYPSGSSNYLFGYDDPLYPYAGFIHSNHTIDDITNDVVFFYPTLTVLLPIMGRIPMNQVLIQVVLMMTISLGLVVSFLGLRKALAWLSTMLRKA